MKIKIIKPLLWDYQLNDLEIKAIYKGRLVVGGMDEFKLKARILNSYNWYTLVKELGWHEAKSLLKPEIIRFIHPQGLKKSYLDAARILQR
ncbi:MAG: hypothetical protein ACK417_08835 [Bacteroidia bacterium]